MTHPAGASSVLGMLAKSMKAHAPRILDTNLFVGSLGFLRLFVILILFVTPPGFVHLATAADDLPKIETVLAPTPAELRANQVRTEAKRLRLANDFDGLEALADSLRSSQERDDSGTWLLGFFYRIASEVPSDPAKEMEAVTFHENWVQARPNSITAQVALAMAQTNWAWNARGGGYSKSVTDEGWRLFAERLENASEVLKRASTLSAKCPGWYDVASKVALGQGWDRELYLVMTDEGLRSYPTYGRIITNACYWQFPRWHGEPGDFESWIAEQANQAPEAIRDRSYAQMVWLADLMRMSSDIIFASGRLDWDRTKAGFAAILSEDPENLVVRSEFARLALLAKDRTTAREQFEILGGRYFPPVWQDSPNLFKAAQSYAMDRGVNPFFQSDNSADLTGLDPKAKQWISSTIQWVGSAIGGLIAGVLLLILAIQNKQTIAGILALAASVALAAAFGTIATIACGGLLYLFLRRTPAPKAAGGYHRWWVVLLMVIASCVVIFGSQLGAVGFWAASYSLEHSGAGLENLETELFFSGTGFRIAFNGFWLLLLWVLVVARIKSPGDLGRRLGFFQVRDWSSIFWTVLTTIVLIALGWVLSLISDPRTIAAGEMMALGVHSPVYFIIAIVIAAPVSEELLFRGYAFSAWLPKFGPWATALVTSVLFTALHFHYGPVGLMSVFLFGLGLAFLRFKTGSIYPCILVHSLINLTFCLDIFINQGK